jgi:prepilin-type N-terminal cleavage/methylation domain-containing protein
MHRTNLSRRRPAFTLIEMLVVIGIIVVLATLSVAIIPSVQQRTKAARAADQVQGWLLIARERALRDRLPRGVRLIIDVDSRFGYVARNLVYIEQPDPFTGGAIMFDTPGQPTSLMNKASFVGNVDITGGQAGTQPFNDPLWLIQPGDYLQIQGGGSHFITAVYPPNPAAGTPAYVLTATNLWDSVNLPPAPATPTPPYPAYSTTAYLVTRSPRPIADEKALTLPDDVVIDLNSPALVPPGVPTPPAGVQLSVPDATAGIADPLTPNQILYDILFSPSGALTGNIGNGNGKVILWFRDVTKDYPLMIVATPTGTTLLPAGPGSDTGEQHLLVISSRTGRIGAVQFNNDPNVPSPGNYNPYFYVFDPRNSGL